MVTLELIKNKRDSLIKLNQEENRQLIDNVSKSEIMYRKLRNKEG